MNLIFYFARKRRFYFLAVSPEQNPNFFQTKSRCGMNRPATASLHSATPKKNVPCFPDLAVVKSFLKKERTFFFGVLPSRSRAGGGTMRTKFCKSYFLGKGFRKTSAHLFLNSDVANGKGGVWGGIFHLLLFLFWGNSGYATYLLPGIIEEAAFFTVSTTGLLIFSITSPKLSVHSFSSSTLSSSLFGCLYIPTMA